jgi:hypothetical protein
MLQQAWLRGVPIMNKLMVLATVAVLPLLSARPAFSQAAINEPGLYSFYHPDGDLLGVGARSIRPGGGTLSTSPSTALAASPPRASRFHRRTQRTAN